MTIESYDADSGIITFTNLTKWYHWGAPGSTAS